MTVTPTSQRRKHRDDEDCEEAEVGVKWMVGVIMYSGIVFYNDIVPYKTDLRVVYNGTSFLGSSFIAAFTRGGS